MGSWTCPRCQVALSCYFKWLALRWWNFMFAIIDRYIAKEFLKFFAGALIIFCTLYLAVDMLSNIWNMKVESTIIWKYYTYQMPMIMYRMTPVSCLMATIFTISSMSRNNELVALFSAGVSLARASLPVLVSTFLIAVLSFFVADKVIPPAIKKKNYIDFVEIKKRPGLYYTVKTNKIWYRSRDLIYNIRTLQPEKHAVQGLTIYYFNDLWRISQVINAKEATYEGKNWILKDGNVTLFSSDNSFPITEKFKEKSINLEESPGDMGDIDNDRDIMTIGELKRYISKNKEAGVDTTRYEVAYHSRFSFAFVSVVMAFLGIPFSVSKDRSGSFAMNIGICLGLVFAYWTLVSIGMTLGSHGQVPAFVAAWMPNAVMLFTSVILLYRLKK